jgi:hypothetical protein
LTFYRYKVYYSRKIAQHKNKIENGDRMQSHHFLPVSSDLVEVSNCLFCGRGGLISDHLMVAGIFLACAAPYAFESEKSSERWGLKSNTLRCQLLSLH